MPKKVPNTTITADPHNANMGTKRGAEMIAESIRHFGFVDAGVLDRNNVIIGGNQRTKAAEEIGMNLDDAIIVDHDGSKPIFIRLTNYDLTDTDDTKARELAYALNRTQQVSLKWNKEQTAKDLASGLNLSAFFGAKELMPKKPAKEKSGEYKIIIDCDDEEMQIRLLKTLLSQGIPCKALIS